ncbi:MAG: UDP-N-acetylmuramate dehydrogenase [Bacteroidales bacterium]
MLEISHNQSLKPYNTFGIDVRARLFCEIIAEKQLNELMQEPEFDRYPLLLLGGGSNILFTDDVDGLVVKISTKGRKIISENSETVLVRAEAGENWDDFVAWSLEQGFSGLENLSLIPGNVGSSPIQNIGAYGVELKDRVEEVEIIYLANANRQILQNKDCRFGYRDSIFKHELKGKAVIIAVTFKLRKSPELYLEYGAISRELAEMGIQHSAPVDVRDAVCRIRRNKLPDPTVLGNAGSFFKNPTISAVAFAHLSGKFSDIPSFHQEKGTFKLAAGWLIEQCGWKGARHGDVGVHSSQALVLVNYGTATGNQILKLANEIQESVAMKFGVELEMEVNIL